jgi:(1->4)-alpha-D-glucan 1-alpha-D-glucosylmutase
LREAKLFSDWAAPDEAYEAAAEKIVQHIFLGSSSVLAELSAFVDRIAAPGAVNSLGQTLVKLTAPGVPDIYQGTEYWDQSLVDPDNRTAVDFAVRKSTLGSGDIANWCNGKTKQALVQRILAVRKKYPRVFSEGNYIPLVVSGALQNQLIGFARSLPDIAVIVLICRFNARFASGSGSLSIPAAACKYTSINVPQDFCGTYRDAISPHRNITINSETSVAQALESWPISVLVKAPS